MKKEIPPWAIVVAVIAIVALVGAFYWTKSNEGTTGSVDVVKLIGPPPAPGSYKAPGAAPGAPAARK